MRQVKQVRRTSGQRGKREQVMSELRDKSVPDHFPVPCRFMLLAAAPPPASVGSAYLQMVHTHTYTLTRTHTHTPLLTLGTHTCTA